MKFKPFFKKFFVAIFILLSFAALPSFTSAASNITAKSQKAGFVKYTYTYERVLIENQWWMYVYDEDGSVVDMYPIDE